MNDTGLATQDGEQSDQIKPHNEHASIRETGSASITAPKPIPDVRIVAFEALPASSDNPNFLKRMCTALVEQLPPEARTSISPSALICTRVPPIPDTHNTTEVVLYSRTLPGLLAEPGFNERLPPPFEHPLPAYEIRDAPPKGQGMFATRPLDIGELIILERPLMVVPMNTDLSGIEYGATVAPMAIYEPMLEVAFNRMSEENQKAYLDLAVSRKNDKRPRLVAIWDTNCFGIGKLGRPCSDKDEYSAVFKDMSRINHSCRPNCALSYDPSSFSFQGEEFFYSYCFATLPVEERQDELKPYGFSCTCISCVPTPSNPSNDRIRASILGRFGALKSFYCCDTLEQLDTAREIYNTTHQLMKDMEQEGMEGTAYYYDTMDMCIEGTLCLSIFGEAEKLKLIAARLALAHEGCLNIPARHKVVLGY
ncbi:hypothetical protein BDQ17DRAFT_1368609 [Cyathus striatus]|nr:hypothetical protein BDQ17DRAFT_1368609 [Cyathus striatus]